MALNSANSLKTKLRLSPNKSLKDLQVTANSNFILHKSKLDDKSNEIPGYQSDGSLKDFKSPQKLVPKKKKVTKLEQKRAWANRAPPPPHGFKSTPEMFVSLMRERKSTETEYLSENEFEVFAKIKKTPEHLQETQAHKPDSLKNYVKLELAKPIQSFDTSNVISKSFREAESQTDTPVIIETCDVGTQYPEINFFDDSSANKEKEDEIAPKNHLKNRKSLRTEFHSMNVQNVVVAESDDETTKLSKISSQAADTKEYLQNQMRLLRKKVKKLPSLKGFTRPLDLYPCYFKTIKHRYLRKLWWLNKFLRIQYLQARIRDIRLNSSVQ